MKKSILLTAAFALCFAASAQSQPNQSKQEKPQEKLATKDLLKRKYKKMLKQTTHVRAYDESAKLEEAPATEQKRR